MSTHKSCTIDKRAGRVDKHYDDSIIHTLFQLWILLWRYKVLLILFNYTDYVTITFHDKNAIAISAIGPGPQAVTKNSEVEHIIFPFV